MEERICGQVKQAVCSQNRMPLLVISTNKQTNKKTALLYQVRCNSKKLGLRTCIGLSLVLLLVEQPACDGHLYQAGDYLSSWEPVLMYLDPNVQQMLTKPYRRLLPPPEAEDQRHSVICLKSPS